MTTESPKRKSKIKSCLFAMGGLAGIVAILGLAIAAVQFWFQLNESKSQEKGQSTLIAISDAQLQAEKTLVALQMSPGSNEQIEEIKATIESLQTLREDLEAQIDGKAKPDVSPNTEANNPVATDTPEPSISFPFIDDFDNGLRPEWRVVSGEPAVINGKLGSVGEEVSIKLDNILPITKVIEFDFLIPNVYPSLSISLGDDVRIVHSIHGLIYQVFSENEWIQVGESETGSYYEGRLRIEINGNKHSIFNNGTKIFEIVHGQEISGDLTITLDDYSTNMYLLDNFVLSTE